MSNSEKQRHDPLIDEVRQRRAQLSARHGGDLMKLYEAIRALQEEHPEKVARPERKG